MASLSLSDQVPISKAYFGYGSNLWLHQMRLRCPTSTYLGVARLPGYKWIINGRGYANIVETGFMGSQGKVSRLNKDSQERPSGKADEVYGLTYSLLPTDEARLDRNEGVPEAYTKEVLECEFWASNSKERDGWVDVTKAYENKTMLVYIDRKRVEADNPKEEYIHRMNMGIIDAVEMGVPKEYIEGVMRGFIPDDCENEDIEGNRVEGNGGKRRSTEEKALKQAENFVDESSDEE